MRTSKKKKKHREATKNAKWPNCAKVPRASNHAMWRKEQCQKSIKGKPERNTLWHRGCNWSLMTKCDRYLTEELLNTVKMQYKVITVRLNQHFVETIKEQLHVVSFTTLRFMTKLPFGNCWYPRPTHKHITWCKQHKTWTPEQWKNGLWSDELTFTNFPTFRCVYISGKPNPQCLLLTV